MTQIKKLNIINKLKSRENQKNIYIMNFWLYPLDY